MKRPAMPNRVRSFLSPLSRQTFRMYPACRTLAYYRRNLGNGDPRLAVRWTALNGDPHWERLSQTRFAVISILVSLNLPYAIIEPAAYWITARAAEEVPILGEATNISTVENGKHPITPVLQTVLDVVYQLAPACPLTTGAEILAFRNRLNLSQTRLAALCLIASAPLMNASRQTLANAIIANQYYCPCAGDVGRISHIECGSRQLTRASMRAFCRTFSYLLNRPVHPSELFDDYLEEIEACNNWENEASLVQFL